VLGLACTYIVSSVTLVMHHLNNNTVIKRGLGVCERECVCVCVCACVRVCVCMHAYASIDVKPGVCLLGKQGCMACALSLETKKERAREIACNSCMLAVLSRCTKFSVIRSIATWTMFPFAPVAETDPTCFRVFVCVCVRVDAYHCV